MKQNTAINNQSTPSNKATLTRDEALRMIYRSDGKVFSVRFTKKDGSERTMACRLGVKKHLKGGENTTRHIPTLVTVFDMNNGYRNVNLETLQELHIDGAEYEVK